MAGERHNDRVDAVAAAAPAPGAAAGSGGTRSAFVNAGWNAFATFWTIAVAFVVTKLLIQRLGADHFGLLLLVWSVTGLLGIANLGLGEATLRYVARYHAGGDLAGVNRVFRSTLAFYVVMCAAVSAILLAAAPAIAGWLNLVPGQQATATWLLRLTGPVFSCGILARAFGAIPMALNRYDVSGKVGIAESVVRSVGYVVIVTSGFGLLQVVLWDLVAQFGVLCVQVAVARRLLPSLRPLPAWSLSGLREIFGYSVYSFLTFAFHAVYRESGKLVLGTRLGPAPVAYFGTPDSVAYRLYMVLVNGGETLMPRFSANADARAGRQLLLNATWASLALSVVVMVPLAAVMPDLLRLWIGPEFASRSAAAGRVVALCYIAQAGFAPVATFYRGTGRPWFVTAVMAAAAVVTVAAVVVLVPSHGAAGVAYAYLLSSVPWLGGLAYGWLGVFGRASAGQLLRCVGLPLAAGGVAFAVGHAALGRLGELDWFGVIGFGGLFAGMTAALVFGADWAQGGDAPSRRIVEGASRSRKVQALVRLLPLGQAR